jgi:hypothetical protein
MNRRFLLSFFIAGLLSFCFLSCGNNEIRKVNEPLVGEIQCGEDDQQFFYLLHDVIRTAEGYYFINNQNLLCFFDLSTQRTVPVCGRPNCLHGCDDVECDANLTFIHQIHGLWYYNNEIYIGAYDFDQYTYYLFRITKDGSRRTRVCDLLSLDPETTEKGSCGNDINNLVIHRGYAYFTVNESETRTALFKVKLEKRAEAKRIYSVDGNYLDIGGLKGIGDNLYFCSTIPFNTSVMEQKKCLLHYDIVAETVEKDMEALKSDYFLYKDKIYFLTDTEFCMLEERSNTAKAICRSNGYRFFSFDGQYFYMDNVDFFHQDKERFITVIDKNGSIIDKIIIEDGFYCVFGDDRYLFCYWLGDSGMILKAFDKSQVGTTSRIWIELIPEAQ